MENAGVAVAKGQLPGYAPSSQSSDLGFFREVCLPSLGGWCSAPTAGCTEQGLPTAVQLQDGVSASPRLPFPISLQTSQELPETPAIPFPSARNSN